MTFAHATGKFERKWLAHFVDVTFGGTTRSYKRIGKDLEEYSIEMNADVEQIKNILGEASTRVKGYTPQASVGTFFAEVGNPLFEKLYSAIVNRTTGDGIKTKIVDAVVEYYQGTITVVDAYIEDVVIVPQSIGGADGVQIPYEIYYSGNRTAITGTISGDTFTPST